MQSTHIFNALFILANSALTAKNVGSAPVFAEEFVATKHLVLGLPVKIHIPNVYKVPIYVRVSVEQLESGKWVPFAPCLLAEQLKPKDLVHKIKPGGEDLFWKIKESHEAFHPKLGQIYRFTIQVSNTDVIHTDSFDFIKK